MTNGKRLSPLDVALTAAVVFWVVLGLMSVTHGLTGLDVIATAMDAGWGLVHLLNVCVLIAFIVEAFRR